MKLIQLGVILGFLTLNTNAATRFVVPLLKADAPTTQSFGGGQLTGTVAAIGVEVHEFFQYVNGAHDHEYVAYMSPPFTFTSFRPSGSTNNGRITLGYVVRYYRLSNLWNRSDPSVWSYPKGLRSGVFVPENGGVFQVFEFSHHSTWHTLPIYPEPGSAKTDFCITGDESGWSVRLLGSSAASEPAPLLDDYWGSTGVPTYWP